MRSRLLICMVVIVAVSVILVCSLRALPSFLHPGETTGRNSFIVRYVWSERFSDDPDYLFTDSLVISSNGDSWHDVFIQTVEPPNYHTNHSAVLSTKLSSRVHDTLKDEGFLALADCYPNASSGQSGVIQSVDVAVESPDYHKTVTFAHDAMIGILPKSYSIISNVLYAVDQGSSRLLDLALQVSASPSSDPSVVTISGDFMNDGDKVIEGKCGSSPFLITIVSSDGQLIEKFPEFSNLDGAFSFKPHTEYHLSTYQWNISGLRQGVYVIEGYICGSLGGVCNFATYQV
jgi:hypothetical protein